MGGAANIGFFSFFSEKSRKRSERKERKKTIDLFLLGRKFYFSFWSVDELMDGRRHRNGRNPRRVRGATSATAAAAASRPLPWQPAIQRPPPYVSTVIKPTGGILSGGNGHYFIFFPSSFSLIFRFFDEGIGLIDIGLCR